MRAGDTPRMIRAQMLVRPEYILDVVEKKDYVEITGKTGNIVTIYLIYDDGSVLTK